MAVKVPQGSHIKRKRGVYHYRRRLPHPGRSEVTLSLATRHFREAEHRAGLLDQAFSGACGRAVTTEQDDARLAVVLREYLREALNRDLDRRVDRQPGQAVYAGGWEPEDGPMVAADLAAIRNARASLVHDLERNAPDDLLDEAAGVLMGRHGLPPALRARLIAGMLEAGIRALETAERRTLGTEPLVFQVAEQATPATLPAADPSRVPCNLPPKPAASELVEPFFVRREAVDRATHQVMGQERGTLRRFLEACEDRPVDTYGRGDITGFLDTLRRLPGTYGKSPKDKDRSLAEIIAEADARGAERLTDKTVKRHLSALSQFFQLAVDGGHMSVAARHELVNDHRFRERQGAREQRDEWSAAELKKLFSSPVWTGCHPFFRSEPGTTITRDARFWLPLLALHHGARLEEFADLYRRDMGCEDGIWFLKITETEGRRLKTDNAERVVPLHPEMLKLGFVKYVEQTAPRPDDPLFPELKPQGPDKKRGPRITRWFVEYRRAVGVFRDDVGMHAFRHTAITRLRDAIKDHQQDRHVDFLMGHARGGGEGRQRYDKGPQLRAAAATLALLSFPEIPLAHLHVEPEESPRAA